MLPCVERKGTEVALVHILPTVSRAVHSVAVVDPGAATEST